MISLLLLPGAAQALDLVTDELHHGAGVLLGQDARHHLRRGGGDQS